MGSVKLLKGSEEFEMFQDYWKMMQSVWSVENTKEYWEKVVEDTDRFYRKYQMSTGINGYGNGTMTREEHQETERSVLSSLVVAMSGIQKLIGEYASLEEDGLLPEMAAEEIMQINAESVDQYEAIQKAFRLGMEKAKSENVVEHPVYGSEDMEELRQCVLIDLEDCMTKDRETGEKGEALCMTFQNEEGKYINVSYLDGQLSISDPYRK